MTQLIATLMIFAFSQQVMAVHDPERMPIDGKVVYELTSTYNIRHASYRSGEIVLESLELLPVGTRVELNGQDTGTTFPYVVDGVVVPAGDEDFFSNVKILSAPGKTAREVERFNEQSLYVGTGVTAHEFVPDVSDYLSTQGFEIRRSTEYVNGILPRLPIAGQIIECARKELSTRELSHRQLKEIAVNYAINLADSGDKFPDDLHFELDFEALGLKSSKAKVEALRERRCSVEPLMTRIFNQDIITIVNFGLPADQKRQYTINVRACEKGQQAITKYRVAHGVNSSLSGWSKDKSEMEVAARFSNRDWSKQSSIGYFLTGATYDPLNVKKYIGGLSLYGFESTNDLACQRDIIAHGAEYIEPSFKSREGFFGRSWGCPAVERQFVKSGLFDEQRGGSLYVILRGENGVLN